MTLKRAAIASLALVFCCCLAPADGGRCDKFEMLIPYQPECERSCFNKCPLRSKRRVLMDRPTCVCLPGYVRRHGECVPISYCEKYKPPCPPTTLTPRPCPTTTTRRPPTTTPCQTTTTRRPTTTTPCPTTTTRRPTTTTPCPTTTTSRPTTTTPCQTTTTHRPSTTTPCPTSTTQCPTTTAAPTTKTPCETSKIHPSNSNESPCKKPPKCSCTSWSKNRPVSVDYY